MANMIRGSQFTRGQRNTNMDLEYFIAHPEVLATTQPQAVMGGRKERSFCINTLGVLILTVSEEAQGYIRE